MSQSWKFGGSKSLNGPFVTAYLNVSLSEAKRTRTYLVATIYTFDISRKLVGCRTYTHKACLGKVSGSFKVSLKSSAADLKLCSNLHGTHDDPPSRFFSIRKAVAIGLWTSILFMKTFKKTHMRLESFLEISPRLLRSFGTSEEPGALLKLGNHRRRSSAPFSKNKSTFRCRIRDWIHFSRAALWRTSSQLWQALRAGVYEFIYLKKTHLFKPYFYCKTNLSWHDWRFCCRHPSRTSLLDYVARIHFASLGHFRLFRRSSLLWWQREFLSYMVQKPLYHPTKIRSKHLHHLPLESAP